MQDTVLAQAAKLNKQQRRKKLWRRAVSALAAVVVFCTTYALILPAITMEGKTFCGMEEHVHGDSCYVTETVPEERRLTCAVTDPVVHTHGETCYDSSGELVCTLPELAPHSHTDECYRETLVLICGLEESFHVHREECFSGSESVPVCGLEECAAHTHAEECFDPESGECVCGLEETGGHLHEEACFAPAVVCGLAESPEGHVHGEECRAAVRELICGFDEKGIHTHGETCYGSGGEPVCELSPVGEHVHGEECFSVEPARELRVLVCELPEHSHSLICHSDPEADVETAADWEASVEGAELTGVWAEDLLAVAGTQLGYAESEDNYAVCPDGATQKGYSRYGAWYGDHYGDWCAMFVSFCLDYAHIPAEAFPREAGCQTWINKLSEMGAYAGAEGYIPAPGDLIFFETNGNGIADHVAIVTGTDEKGAVCYIEGNSAVNNVRRERAEPGDGTVVGYGILPENPELPRDCTKTEHTHSEGCYTEVTVAGYTELICPECAGEVSGVLFHTHGGLCFDGNGELICPLAELEPHVHGEECFDGEGELVCELGELAEHTHTEECFDENGGPVCALEQTERHEHSPECVLTVPEYRELICTCGMEEHIHSESCFPSKTEGDEELKLPEDIPLEVLTDISKGPAVFIFAGSPGEPETEQSGDEGVMLLSAFSLRSTGTDMREYLSANGGSYFFTLTNGDNTELEKDEAGNYIVSVGTGYKLSLSILNENGFVPGTYYFDLPTGLSVQGGSGDFVLSDGTNVGSWTVDESGLITMVFNDTMNDRTDVIISATMGISFDQSDVTVDFDGMITVNVVPPPETELDTELEKNGTRGQEAGKLCWKVSITGNGGSSIVGGTVSDVLQSGHSYTGADMQNGLSFTATDTLSGGTHTWTVLPGDSGLTWTETGWTYTVPQTVNCDTCGELALGNEGWVYFVEYTSTVTDTGATGSVTYRNEVNTDGVTARGYVKVNYGGTETAGVEKTGLFLTDASGGHFAWEISVTVPGKAEGASPAYGWSIVDTMRLVDGEKNDIGYTENTIDRARVSVLYGGSIFDVPNIADATGDDLFAWVNSASSDHGADAVYRRQIDLLCRCSCAEDGCSDGENGSCDTYLITDEAGNVTDSGFCRCWNAEGDGVFTFEYETDDPEIVTLYGGGENLVFNRVALECLVKNAEGEWVTSGVDSDSVYVPIPGLFSKELTSEYNGFTAEYTITVNEAKLPLGEGGPLTVHDVMTDTLAYMSGSLLIETEDGEGNRAVLEEGTDYTLSYDGSGALTDENGGAVHVLDIVILEPQAVKYVITYDATLVIPQNATEAVKYSNSASVTLWSREFSSSTEEKLYADINIAAKTYSVSVHKTDSATGEPLFGAVFGLYNSRGGLIAQRTTDESGTALFTTDITNGVILREHESYFIREISAPDGYVADYTEHRFCFCNSTADSCAECDAVLGDWDGFRIPFETVGIAAVTNDREVYTLPATGGGGTGLYTLGGAALIAGAIVPAVYRVFKRRRKEESSSRQA